MLLQGVVVNLRLCGLDAHVLGVTGHVCEVQLVLQEIMNVLEVSRKLCVPPVSEQ